ncbi:VTT domain-containing protein [Streptomyces sp. NBC_00536]|uniref:DedA family protein n=1 Tax=Streptomyces sp. NBC_00536 TaxID=2975769 RepID=UPI002E80CC64|nr:VTT domain-containing protein [Streptomyces sp. NBC_00536]WUC83961.1 VTT domain-containing protein [Streptomyces sp. NBC_00536]
MYDAVHQVQQAPAESTQQVVGYPALFVLVALGALVPVIPTGALVSSAAVVAFHQRSLPFGLVLVFAVAALGAFLGDVALYRLGERGVRSRSGSRWLEALRRRAGPERLDEATAKLDEHGVLVLVVSRLVPAGRIPVMLACLLARLPLRRFARGDAPACLAWAATYGLIGIVGGSLFSEPWKGVALAVGLTLLISTAPALWRRARGATTSPPGH